MISAGAGSESSGIGGHKTDGVKKGTAPGGKIPRTTSDTCLGFPFRKVPILPGVFRNEGLS
jgi:hypothetical protein